MAPANYNLLLKQNTKTSQRDQQQNSQAETTNKRIKGKTNSQLGFCSCDDPFSGRETSVPAHFEMSHELSQWTISFCMFLRKALWLMSLSHVKSLCGCCCLGPAPFLFALLILRRNANLAGGFAGRPVLVFLFVYGYVDLPFHGPYVSCTKLLFTAYAIVRTEP